LGTIRRRLLPNTPDPLLMLSNIPALIGLSGVSPDENPRARFWAGVIEVPLLLVALWLMLSWYIEVSHHKPEHLHQIEDWLVWCFFLGETLFLTYLVDEKKRYLKDNWLNLVIIVAGIPIAFGDTAYISELRLLRMMLVFSIIIHLMIPIRNLLARNHFGATLAVAFIIITFVGILAAGIDPGIGDHGWLRRYRSSDNSRSPARRRVDCWWDLFVFADHRQYFCIPHQPG